MTRDEQIEFVRRLPWKATYTHSFNDKNGVAIDMYALLIGTDGEIVASLGIAADGNDPQHKASGHLAEYICRACSDPWFSRARPAGDTSVAKAFNRALLPLFDREGEMDAREIVAGALAIVEAYLQPLPRRRRIELLDRLIPGLNAMRGK